jgi:hypothetical protein
MKLVCLHVGYQIRFYFKEVIFGWQKGATPMIYLLTLHSIVRWVLVLVALALLVKYTLGWLRRQPFDRTASALASAFGGLMDLQLLLGLLYFLISGFGGAGFPRFRWEHLGIMAIAVVVGHLPSMWKKLEDGKRYRNSLIAVIAALILVVVGISLLPGSRWLHITGLF